MIETTKHLYQPPLYRDASNKWSDSYSDAIEGFDSLTIDHVAIASIISFSAVSQDRTLFQEIKRLPWLAQPNSDGTYILEELPKHGFFTGSDDCLAKCLFDLLCNEARKLLEQKKQIYILLTGGLDSRIIAGIFSHLHNSGEMTDMPKCLTWGIENSRDVQYASRLARALNCDWQNIPLTPENVKENIEKCGELTGLIHSPEMLHSMLWFKNIPRDSIVIAGSFGDSIGRGEFSNKHLLQLKYKIPANTYGLLNDNYFKNSLVGVSGDLEEIYTRGGPATLTYMQCEYWMQGYRMRNSLCHALSVINRFAHVYQMFTAPEVYSFMWSLHPSRRDDNIYVKLLKDYFPQLALIPWARTNKPISGSFRLKNLETHYHNYSKWSSQELYDYISRLVDPEWFESKGIFNPYSIIKMRSLVQSSTERVGRLNDTWLWLAGFRFYIDKLERLGVKIRFNHNVNEASSSTVTLRNFSNIAVVTASKSSTVNHFLKGVRNWIRRREVNCLKKRAIRRYPPGRILV